MLDSLVRVSRRVAWDHYASVLGLGPRTSAPPRRMTTGVITLAQRRATSPGPFSDGQGRRWPDGRRVHRTEARVFDGRQGLMPNASLSTISRTVSLSFQSAFHLSITLLVRYRSLASI